MKTHFRKISSLQISELSLKDKNDDVQNVTMLEKNHNYAQDARDEEIFRELLPRRKHILPSTPDICHNHQNRWLCKFYFSQV